MVDVGWPLPGRTFVGNPTDLGDGFMNPSALCPAAPGGPWASTCTGSPHPLPDQRKPRAKSSFRPTPAPKQATFPRGANRTGSQRMGTRIKREKG